MNQFLQNNLLTLIVFLLIIILVLIGVLSFVIFKLLAQKDFPHNHYQPQPDQSTNTKSTAKPALNLTEAPIKEKFVCNNHPDASTAGACLICEDVFCEACLVEHEGMFFCKQHFRTYANYKWKQITDFKTSPHNPEEGMFIYNYKRKQWAQKEKPSFVITHYKINVEEDLIESYIQLHVREEDEVEFSKGLSELIN